MKIFGSILLMTFMITESLACFGVTVPRKGEEPKGITKLIRGDPRDVPSGAPPPLPSDPVESEADYSFGSSDSYNEWDAVEVPKAQPIQAWQSEAHASPVVSQPATNSGWQAGSQVQETWIAPSSSAGNFDATALGPVPFGESAPQFTDSSTYLKPSRSEVFAPASPSVSDFFAPQPATYVEPIRAEVPPALELEAETWKPEPGFAAYPTLERGGGGVKTTDFKLSDTQEYHVPQPGPSDPIYPAGPAVPAGAQQFSAFSSGAADPGFAEASQVGFANVPQFPSDLGIGAYPLESAAAGGHTQTIDLTIGTGPDGLPQVRVGNPSGFGGTAVNGGFGGFSRSGPAFPQSQFKFQGAIPGSEINPGVSSAGFPDIVSEWPSPGGGFPGGAAWDPVPPGSQSSAPNPFPLSFGDQRNAQQAAVDAGDALTQVLQGLNSGDLSFLPKETLNSIPASILGKLDTSVLATLPDEILAKLSVDTHIASTALGELVQYLPIDRLDDLPWPTVIKGLPADAINSFSPTVIGAIDWKQHFKNMPPDVVGALAPSVLHLIPPNAWSTIRLSQLQAIKPNTLATLPLSSLKAIPPGFLIRLGGGILSAFPKDVLSAISPELLTVVSNSGASHAGDTLAQASARAGRTFTGLSARS